MDDAPTDPIGTTPPELGPDLHYEEIAGLLATDVSVVEGRLTVGDVTVRVLTLLVDVVPTGDITEPPKRVPIVLARETAERLDEAMHDAPDVPTMEQQIRDHIRLAEASTDTTTHPEETA